MRRRIRIGLTSVFVVTLFLNLLPGAAAYGDAHVTYGDNAYGVSNMVSSEAAEECVWENIPDEEMREVLAGMPDHSVGNCVTSNEIDLLLACVEQTPAALSDGGSVETERRVREELLRRKELPDQTLKNYGYTDDEIRILRGLTGTEPLEAYRSLAAEFTCYNALKFHRYYTDIDVTHFVYTFAWEWDRFPLLSGQSAIVELGWNENLMLGYETSASWNYHYLTYLKDDGSTSNVRARLVENDFNRAEHSFTMIEPKGSGWAQSGRGTISLYAAGRFDGLKGGVQYGFLPFKLGLLALVSRLNLKGAVLLILLLAALLLSRGRRRRRGKIDSCV